MFNLCLIVLEIGINAVQPPLWFASTSLGGDQDLCAGFKRDLSAFELHNSFKFFSSTSFLQKTKREVRRNYSLSIPTTVSGSACGFRPLLFPYKNIYLEFIASACFSTGDTAMVADASLEAWVSPDGAGWQQARKRSLIVCYFDVSCLRTERSLVAPALVCRAAK